MMSQWLDFKPPAWNTSKIIVHSEMHMSCCRLTLQECAMDLLTLRCNCEGHNCMDKMRRLDSAAQSMACDRFQLVQCGHRKSSKWLFDRLQTMRVCGSNQTKPYIRYYCALHYKYFCVRWWVWWLWHFALHYINIIVSVCACIRQIYPHKCIQTPLLVRHCALNYMNIIACVGGCGGCGIVHYIKRILLCAWVGLVVVTLCTKLYQYYCECVCVYQTNIVTQIHTSTTTC